MTEKKQMREIVYGIWGSWDELRYHVKKLMKVARKNGGEIGSCQFKRELMGKVRLTEDEYRLASKAIHITISGILKEEHEQELEKTDDPEKEIKKKRSFITKQMIEGAREWEKKEIKRTGDPETYHKILFG